MLISAKLAVTNLFENMYIYELPSTFHLTRNAISKTRNEISKIDDAVLAPVASTLDVLVNRLHCVHDTAYLLYQKKKKKFRYGRTLKDTVKNEAEKDYRGMEDN